MPWRAGNERGFYWQMGGELVTIGGNVGSKTRGFEAEVAVNAQFTNLRLVPLPVYPTNDGKKAHIYAEDWDQFLKELVFLVLKREQGLSHWVSLNEVQAGHVYLSKAQTTEEEA